jgi:hypothetical protein
MTWQSTTNGLLRVLLAATIGILVSRGGALAQNAHFVKTPTASFTEDFDILSTFKEAGVGNNVSITYNLTATATGACACVTKNGNCPQAANKIPPIGVLGTGTLESDKNGNIVGSLIAEEPECQQVSPATCPHGQTNTLTSISYSDITLTDTNNNVSSLTKPSALSATIFSCPNS